MNDKVLYWHFPITSLVIEQYKDGNWTHFVALGDKLPVLANMTLIARWTFKSWKK